MTVLWQCLTITGSFKIVFFKFFIFQVYFADEKIHILTPLRKMCSPLPFSQFLCPRSSRQFRPTSCFHTSLGKWALILWSSLMKFGGMSMFTKKWSFLVRASHALSTASSDSSLPLAKSRRFLIPPGGRSPDSSDRILEKAFFNLCFHKLLLKVFCYAPHNTNLPNVWHHRTHSREYFDLSCHPFKHG